jgi:hypothetical protein
MNRILQAAAVAPSPPALKRVRAMKGLSRGRRGVVVVAAGGLDHRSADREASLIGDGERLEPERSARNGQRHHA